MSFIPSARELPARKRLLLNSQLLRKFLPTLVVRGFGAVAGFAISLLVTRCVSAEEAGLFFIAFALIQSGGRLVSLGAPEMCCRLVGANGDGDWTAINHELTGVIRRIAQIGLTLFVLLSVFSMTIATTAFGKPALAPLLSWAALSILTMSLIQVFAAALQGKHRILTSSFVHNFLGPATFTAIVFSLHALGVEQNARWMAVVYALALGIALASAAALWYRDSRATWIRSAVWSPQLRRSVAAMFVVVAMDMGVQWSGYVATSTLLPAEEVALFATAHRTAMLNSFLLIGINLIVVPRFAGAHAAKRFNEIDNLALQSSRIMLACAIPVTLATVVFPERIMSIFGPEYAAGAVLLRIMAIGQFVNLLTGSVGELLPMTGHERDYRNVVLLTGPFSIISAAVLTYYFGAVGAALATAVSVATQNLLAVRMVKKRLGFNTLNIFRRVPSVN